MEIDGNRTFWVILNRRLSTFGGFFQEQLDFFAVQKGFFAVALAQAKIAAQSYELQEATATCGSWIVGSFFVEVSADYTNQH